MKRAVSVVLILISASFSLLASPAVWDYDGDGKTDLVIRRIINEANQWFILKSRDGFYTINWGNRVLGSYGDGQIPGDYDGDGKWDIAVTRGYDNSPYRYFFILNSNSNTMTFAQWGLTGDQPMLQDYDGDGKTDIAVYRATGWWYIINSSNGGNFRFEKFGESVTGSHQDQPLYGDYDGDGKADLAVARVTGNSFQLPQPITFYIQHSSNGTWRSFTMGDRRGDAVVPGDYDGDGNTDLALWGGKNIEFGDGRWRWIRSSDGQFVSVRFGFPGDDAVPGDYDGDGKTDYAVYRRGPSNNSQNYFYIQGSTMGFKAIAWGNSVYFDDTPMSSRNYN